MSDSDTRHILSALGGDGPALVGMVHLLPLPGAPEWGGSMEGVLERAMEDARAIEAAGFDALIVENFLDAPFYKESIPPETVAALTSAVVFVSDIVDIPVGVNALRNDAAAALGIAAATRASFIRINVHTGAMWTDQGLIEGRAAETLRRRAALDRSIGIVADVHVKHAVPPSGSALDVSARDAWERGRADALVLSGSGTGQATDLTEVHRVREALPDATIWVGSGASPETASATLAVADGVIVGSSIMNEGRPGAGIDPVRAAAFVRAARG